MRFIAFFFGVLFLQSCSYFSLSNNEDKVLLDANIDFSDVDRYPTFENCTEFIEKIEKEFCFRETIYHQVGQALDKYQLKSNDSINEIIVVKLKIDSKGFFNIHSMISSPNLKTMFPQFDSIIYKGIETLPKVFPATKRGIPVATLYELPIHLKKME